MLTLTENITAAKQKDDLGEIERLDQDLYHYFKDKFYLDVSLSRALVSFQANKSREVYRWYKFKEAFSASLVEYLLEKDKIVSGTILDPFAGSGTALFAAIAKGTNADGIELLRIGQQIINTKKIVALELTKHDYSVLNLWQLEQPWKTSGLRAPLNELRITKDAYPEQTKDAVERYLGACDQENERVRAVLQFALLCILESISYTRKDGQYLRWDYRSGRRQGEKPFDKGDILGFDDAICTKIKDILFDSQTKGKQKSLFPSESARGKINLYCGSCLDILPTIPAGVYGAIITSPPYCNRYDYTRTYALELALSGIGEQELVNLRQQMLSCTVENRTKDLLAMNHGWAEAIAAADQQEALQAVLKYLDDQKAQGLLNNNGIPRMVRGCFYEMACVIADCSRVLKPNAPLFMVNDNVRFAGASISVDMILSDIAEMLGFRIENILVLPNGKGNSSQQMGKHGREMLRKCVYIWRRTR